MRWRFALIVIVAAGVGCGDNIHPAIDAGVGSDAQTCTNACTPGDKTCAADGTLVTCILDANECAMFPSGGGIACADHEACAAGSNACACATDASCSAGAGTYCTTDVLNNDTPATYTCTTDANGCVFAQPAFDDCGAHQSCTGGPGTGTCTCNTDANCDAGAGTYCTTDAGTAATYSCVTDAQSCVYADLTPTDCGTHQSCTGADGVGTCTCNTDLACASGAGSFCDSGDASFTTCATDAQSCVYDVGSTTCTAPTSCTDGGPGDAMCTCPVAGTLAGTGCGTEGEQICSGDGDGDVLTCEAVGTCDIWVATTSCSSASLACAATGPLTAACACPAAPSGTVYADPNATAIVVDGVTVAPSGALAPDGCRFALLGSAIAAAAAAPPTTVMVESATPGSFTADTYPLIVPAGVTVTSDDAAATPTRYTLAPGADHGAALVEGGGALGGLAISANIKTATSPPAAITVTDCSTAQRSASLGPLAITFAANATGAGILLDEPATVTTQACTATIANASMTGAYDGIVVSTPTGASTTTAAATITGSKISASLHDGLVVYQTAAAGVTVSSTTIGGSGVIGVYLDTASAASRTGTIKITGKLGTNTVGIKAAGAEGIVVDNDGTGETATGAQIDLTDVTVVGMPGTTGDAVVYHNGVGTLEGVVVQSAGARGVVATLGSNVTLQDDGAANHTTISAAGGIGAFVDTGSTLGGSNVIVQTSTGWGVDAENSYAGGGGTETLALLTDWTITKNGTAANSDGGMTAAGNDASNTVSVRADGCSFDHNAGIGFVAGANTSITLENADVFDSNGGHGFFMTDPSAQASFTTSPAQAPAFTNNSSYGLAMAGGTLTLTATASAPVTVTGNAGDGIHLTSAAILHAGHLDIASNGNNGVDVALATGGDLQLSSTTIANNSASGVQVDSSPVLGAGYSTTLTANTITGNAVGVSLGNGGGGDVSVDLENNTIEGSTGAGVLYNSTSTTCTLDFGGNYVEGNGGTTIGTQVVGGIGFEGTVPASLLFANNTVGNDGGNEVDVYVTSGTVTYDLGGGGNQLVECSTTSGFVALFAEATVGVIALVVDADDTQWANTIFPGTNTGTAGVAVITTLGATGGASCPGP